MVRVIFTEGLMFLAPFAAFALLLLLQRRRVLDLEHWSRATVWLLIVGMVLVLATFLYKGLFADRPESGFEPTHMENGQLVPGRFN